MWHRSLTHTFTLALALALAPTLTLDLAGCGPSGGRARTDKQGDGGIIRDQNADVDHDGVTPKQGDCNDDDPNVNPNAAEVCDAKDNDCDGKLDEICDVDKDGFAIDADGDLPGGDCNDQDPLIGPGAVDVAGNNLDDNCDGNMDEPSVACDSAMNMSDGKAYAGAFELCDPWVIKAEFHKSSDPKSRGIRKKFGSYKPKFGQSFAVLSTGLAVDASDPSFESPQPGTSFGNDAPNPLPMANNNACYNGPDEMTVHDYVELTLTLRVPTNAKSFSFNFNFMSAEYPEFVGTEFNDKFLAILDSKAYKGNISFDKNMNPITVNAGFFDVCESALICNGTKQNVCTQPITQLNGTGYEEQEFGFGGDKVGGGTGWLTTTSPVSPGETATLRFIIFDEGDEIYDSTVIIDNFQWQVESSDGPITIQ